MTKLNKDVMKTIKVTNCWDCPFVNVDNEYGYDNCSIKEISLGNWEQLPEDKVHEECPLKNESVSVELKTKLTFTEWVEENGWERIGTSYVYKKGSSYSDYSSLLIALSKSSKLGS